MDFFYFIKKSKSDSNCTYLITSSKKKTTRDSSKQISMPFLTAKVYILEYLQNNANTVLCAFTIHQFHRKKVL